MKVKYKGKDFERLTPGVTYLAFEISYTSSKKTLRFRVVNNMGIPALYDVSDFDFDTLDLSHLICIKRESWYVCTLDRIFSLLGESRYINDVWDRYFDADEEMVELVNKIIIDYAKEEQIIIPHPHPYGG